MRHVRDRPEVRRESETLNTKGPDPGLDSLSRRNEPPCPTSKERPVYNAVGPQVHTLSTCFMLQVHLLAGSSQATCGKHAHAALGASQQANCQTGPTESHKACSVLELDRRTSRCGKRSPSVGSVSPQSVSPLRGPCASSREMSTVASLPRPSQLHLCQGGFLQRALLIIILLTNEWVVMMIRERLRSRPACLPAWRSASLSHH